MSNISVSLPVISESIILVDEHDQILGTLDKLAAHQQAILHRAFSIFIFRQQDNQLELLLQQRAFDKYHSAGLWTNSCCGHPRYNESTADAAERRLYEELGLPIKLNYVDSFIYKADVGCGLIEHEFDHIFYQVMPTNIDFNINPQEVVAVKWLDIHSLHADYAINPGRYTAWFKQAFDIMCVHLPRVIMSGQNLQDNVDA